jgi:thiol-disulfide isomerase/thioredoxin
VILRLLIPAALWLALASPLAAQAEDEIGIPRGSTPPPAQVQDLEGRPVDLREFVGRRPVLIEFWASWCSVCAGLLPRMHTAHQRYGHEVEFLVVGVGVNQTPNTMRRHLERHPAPFRFFFDADGAAVRAFQVPATGYIVALDAQGRVVYTGMGDDQDVEAAARRALGR